LTPIWSENYTSAFQEALSSSALQLEIDHFLSTTDMDTVTNINTATSGLANIFTNEFLSLCSIVKTTEWNGLIKIDN
jgi:hypothetical protein